MNKIEYLIISNTKDFSTDLVTYELNIQKYKYLRINRDDLINFKVLLDIYNKQFNIIMNNKKYDLSSIKSIYFRAPTFVRTMNKRYTLEEQVHKSQWGSFLRNLVIFENIRWINSPADTYKAENKIFQLWIANKLKFNIPKTIVTNTQDKCITDKKLYVVKSIDTAYFIDDKVDMFTYSNILSGKEIKNSNLKLAPVFIQEYIYPKIDIRVTIIDKFVFAVKILNQDGLGIDKDWRTIDKDELIYEEIKLPKEIENKLIDLMSYLNLKFAGIDLILSNKKYFFIEINPTGEWGWIQSNTKTRIDKKIVNYMTGGSYE